MAKQARPYQAEAIDATIEYLTTKPGLPLIVAPVAAGKSYLMAETMRRCLKMYPPMQFLSLAHSSTLVQQNAAELAEAAPHIPLSFYCDKLGQKSFDGKAIFGTIQSVYRAAWKLPRIDMLLLDEAHMTGSRKTKMYRGLIDVLRQGNPDIRIVGWTGTPFNLKGGWLHQGDDALFTDIAYSISMTDLIRDGYLCPLTTPQVSAQIDTSGIRTLAGDFKLDELEAASDRPEIIRQCVDEMVRLGADRRHWMVFAVSVQHARHICEEIQSRGIACDVVTGDTSGSERTQVLDALRRGELRAVVNVATLTTGVNVPQIDLIALMRPTRSRILYVQSLGRGMRTHPAKRDCMVLDFGGAVAELGPVDQITVKRPKNVTGEAPIKSCPRCFEFTFASTRVCSSCGYEFPITAGETDLDSTASSAPVLSTQLVEPTWMAVDRVTYARHDKGADGPPTMMVEYACGAATHREWVCLEHKGRPRANAMQWWMKRSSGAIPATVDEAMARQAEIRVPLQVGLLKEGKWWRPSEFLFEAAEAA